MNEITIGASFEKEIKVTENLLAISVGSGDVSVFATPMMLSLMEEVSAKCMLEFLDDGMTSVGINISSSHIAATPLSMNVRAKATITAIDGKKVSFKIEAFDGKEQIGEGTHDRVIVNREKFNARALAKNSDE